MSQLDDMIDSFGGKPHLPLQFEKVRIGRRNRFKKHQGRKLSARWSIELEDDLNTMHGIDVEAEMVSVMQHEIKAEIDTEMLKRMVNAAGGMIPKSRFKRSPWKNIDYNNPSVGISARGIGKI